MKKFMQDVCFFCVFISLVVVYVIYFSIEHNESASWSIDHRNLAKDGFLVFEYKDYAKAEKDAPEPLMRLALSTLPSGYQFMDYSYSIKNATLSTFHRDVTSSQQIYAATNPVYTLILYKYEGCLLSLCPGSNYTYPFVYSQIYNISGAAGTCFLFHSDLLHAGCFNNCEMRDIIQYKIVHQDDVDKFMHLDGISVEKEESTCEDTLYNHFLRKCSYFFELPINTIFNPLLQKKHDDNGILAKIQDYSSIKFYNNI